MHMHNLTEYSDNYSDTSLSLWQFKRHEIEGNVDLTVDGNHIPNSSSYLSINRALLLAEMM